jgi:ubiquinone/menaquinone biosynthesis C-methylase UbiE
MLKKFEDGNLVVPTYEASKLNNVLPLFDANVIEIGCGLGPHAKMLATSTQSYTAIDINNDKILDASRDNLIKQLSFVCGDASKLDVESDSFDIAIACHCLHEVPCHQQINILKEIFRVLKQDGLFAIIDESPSFHSEFQKCFEVVHKTLFYYNHYYCSAHSYWVLEKVIKEGHFIRLSREEINLEFTFASVQDILNMMKEDFKYEVNMTDIDCNIILKKLVNKFRSLIEPNGSITLNEKVYLTILMKGRDNGFI